MTPSRRDFLQRSLFVAPALSAAPALITRKKSAADEADFISLFDGETLNGWHVNPEKIWHGTGGRWTVEEGAIVGEQDPPGSGNGGILLTDRTFGDFELLLEIKPDWGVDSGLFLRGTNQGQSIQMMIDYLEGGIVGHLYGENIGGFGARTFGLKGRLDDNGHLTGFDTDPNAPNDDTSLTYACTAEEWLQAWKIDDWNRVRVVCVGDYPIVKTWINDQLIADFNGATFTHPRYDREEVKATLGREGSIAVQVHGGSDRWRTGAKSRWRNLRIRPL
jgi:hypothetical protein